jgi:hypothetical protein
VPEHNVYVRQPKREVINADMKFSITEDGEKLGELWISRGGVEWWPRNAKKSVVMSWQVFKRRMEGRG